MPSPLFERQILERSVFLNEPADERTDDFMRVAEGNAFRNEVISNIGREQQTRGGRFCRRAVDGQAVDHDRGRFERGSDRVLSLEESFLVFLQILAVSDR